MRKRIAFLVILMLLSATVIHAGLQLLRSENRDPTYQEALWFIESDQTERRQYIQGEYECSNFAEDFRHNAQKIGYKCGLVLVFSPDWNHALNCFNTTDHGLIFIEPQEDWVTELEIGKPYWNRTLFASPVYNDTITSFLITW